MPLKLQPNKFKLVHVKGREMGLADCLSGLPLKETGEMTIDDGIIAEATHKDELLKILKQVISRGWPENRGDVPLEALPFWDYQESTYNVVVYRGEKTCIHVLVELRLDTLKVIHR